MNEYVAVSAWVGIGSMAAYLLVTALIGLVLCKVDSILPREEHY